MTMTMIMTKRICRSTTAVPGNGYRGVLICDWKIEHFLPGPLSMINYRVLTNMITILL